MNLLCFFEELSQHRQPSCSDRNSCPGKVVPWGAADVDATYREFSPLQACHYLENLLQIVPMCVATYTHTKYIFKSFRGFCSFFHLIILTKASSVPRHVFWLWPNSPFVSYLLDLGVFLYFTPSRDSFGAPALAPTPPPQLQQLGPEWGGQGHPIDLLLPEIWWVFQLGSVG